MIKKIRIPLILLAVSAVFAAVVFAMRDSVIINYGIRFYRGLFAAALVCAAAFAVICAAEAAVYSGKQKKQLEKEAETSAARDMGRLSPRRMDGAELRNMLDKNANGKWKSLGSGIDMITAQMDQMDEYQKSLKDLLEENEASALGDTEDILDKVEQNMFRNIRGVLNFMNVADISDAPGMRDKISECLEKNRDLLMKTKDFMYALTEYLNGQGEDTSSDLLETYKETILETLSGQQSL